PAAPRAGAPTAPARPRGSRNSQRASLDGAPNVRKGLECCLLPRWRLHRRRRRRSADRGAEPAKRRSLTDLRATEEGPRGPPNGRGARSERAAFRPATAAGRFFGTEAPTRQSLAACAASQRL